MLFNSYEFLVFFPIVVLLYFGVPHRFRSLLLLVASYYFYMAWRAEYAVLLAASTLIDYSCGLRMARVPKPARRKYLLLSLLTNLGLLFAFKYYGFFSASAAAAAGLLGGSLHLPALDVLLPVGISFYTFQTLSYSIEVYQGSIPAERNLIRFALYVSFFPQLVAGPIERAGALLPQLEQRHSFDAERAANGLKMIAWGMFKKVVIADRLALVVDTVYNDPGGFGGFHYIVATVFFAYQIYCDFSGYSDIAIGAAMVLGIRLMTNFDRPYAARSIGEFWKRWHISLSTWFRDYVYIPLGGNRVAVPRWYANLIIVFAVSGLWHGANWTFVVWGLVHGLYMVVGAASQPLRRAVAERSGLTRCPGLHAALQRATTFGLVCFAWVFFRAENVGQALTILGGAATDWSWLFAPRAIPQAIQALGLSGAEFAWAWCLIALLETVSYLERSHQMRAIMTGRPAVLRWSFYVVLVTVTLNFGVSQEIPFIYFQF